MDVQSRVESYLAGSSNLREAVADLSREAVVARPVPGRWSVLEVVCHLADTDANIAYRIKRILSEDRPTFERVQPERMRAALAYHDREIEQELALFDLGRRQIACILNASPPEAWSRIGIVGDRGERTVRQMIEGAIEHVAHHLAFVVEKRQALRGVDVPS